MIRLKISEEVHSQAWIHEAIKSMSLAHRVEPIPSWQTPEMIAYGKSYQGIEAIKQGLTEIESLVSSWYECRCDKYEFD